jgi:hypothetical protein
MQVELALAVAQQDHGRGHTDALRRPQVWRNGGLRTEFSGINLACHRCAPIC